MATTTRRTNRMATPARWQAALARALAEGVQVRQLAGCGAWIATSGSDAGTAYGLDVTGEIAHGCDCLAGLNGDPICKHRAAFYHAAGLLDPGPPTPAAPAGVAPCPACDGAGWGWAGTGYEMEPFRVSCRVCLGTGGVDVAADDDGAPEPTPAAPCRECHGDGYQRMITGGRLAGWVPVPCVGCGGKEDRAIAA